MLEPPIAASSSKQRHRDFLRSLSAQRPRDAAEEGSRSAQATENRDRWLYLRRYRAWLWPYRYGLALIVLLSLLVVALGMLMPLFTRVVIDYILAAPAERLAQLPWLGCGMIAVVLLTKAADAWRAHRIGVLNQKTVLDLRRRMYDRLLRLPLAELAEMKSGGVVSRLSEDVGRVADFLQSAIVSPGVAGVRMVLALGILFTLSWRLALVALALIPLAILANLFYIYRLRPFYRALSSARSEVSGRVAETFGGIRVVRSFGRERREERQYALAHHTMLRKELYIQRQQLGYSSVWRSVMALSSLGIIWFGAYWVAHGEATLGDIFAAQMYTDMLLYPVWEIVNSWSETQRSLVALGRVFEVLERPAENPDAPDALEAPRRVAELRFHNVNFAYAKNRPVLQDFNLRVPGGSVVALVGPSGAGKTTLTDLVARFHDPASGALFLNGVDLRKIRLAGYRRLLGLVSQEVFLFDGTVYENIAYARPQASREEVAAAARRANADEFIRQLPAGYETVIGERGVKLSGGQRQRLSIARAILADPQILILDEATSNLDTESEQLIQAALAELSAGRTTFVIAHRLSTVRNADLIVVLEGGRSVEVGSHEELLARRGRYYEMVTRQADLVEEAAAVEFERCAPIPAWRSSPLPIR